MIDVHNDANCNRDVYRAETETLPRLETQGGGRNSP